MYEATCQDDECEIPQKLVRQCRRLNHEVEEEGDEQTQRVTSFKNVRLKKTGREILRVLGSLELMETTQLDREKFGM